MDVVSSTVHSKCLDVDAPFVSTDDARPDGLDRFAPGCIQNDRMYTDREIVHARLDPETRRLLARLRRRTRLADSEIVRRAIRAFAAEELEPRKPRLVGVGAFSSGVADLGSNREHLAGFGRK